MVGQRTVAAIVVVALVAGVLLPWLVGAFVFAALAGVVLLGLHAGGHHGVLVPLPVLVLASVWALHRFDRYLVFAGGLDVRRSRLRERPGRGLSCSCPPCPTATRPRYQLARLPRWAPGGLP